MRRKPRIRVAGIPEGFTERSFKIGDVTLNYVVGPENGLPLLLIPGQMESWQGYKPVLPALSEKFHVFVPDLRGHGKSTRTPGQYSYNICGQDLKDFIQRVIKQPALVAGLSSGAVLSIWLGAYAAEDVLAVISEDPPIYSSIWPRIQEEKFLYRNFEIAIDSLGGPGERDLEHYLLQMGGPAEGKEELMMIPPFIVKGLFSLYRLNIKMRPHYPYEVPLLPFYMRAGLKYWSEYDTDFSRATIDGDLSKDFSPDDALSRVKCPVLLMWAGAYRHETWGIIGAMDADDLERVKTLVDDFQLVEIPGRHDIHVAHPQEYVEALTAFVDRLVEEGKLVSTVANE